MIKKKIYLALSIIVASGLLWVAWNSSGKYQGWGGDYAGYLGQTRDALAGREPVSYNYIYNPKLPSLAPPAYPMGFPLFMSPFYALFGPDMAKFCRIMSVIWWFMGLMLFFLLRRWTGSLVALLWSAVFILNPEIFNFKSLVLPDTLFCICLMAATYGYIFQDRTKIRNAVLCGCLAGFTWLLRANGIVFLLAIFLDSVCAQFVQWRQQGRFVLDKSMWRYVFIASVLSLGMQIIVHGLLFKMPESGSYFDQLRSTSASTFQQNLEEVLKSMLEFFLLKDKVTFFNIESSDVVLKIGGSMAFASAIWGFISINGRGFRFLRLLIGLFIGVLCVWPLVQNFRYIFPVYPFFAVFSVALIQNIKTNYSTGTFLKWAIIPLLTLGTYYRIDDVMAQKVQEDEIGSPEYVNNQEAFRYVREHTPQDAIFAYHHPLILGLYADRKCVHWSNLLSPENMLSEFNAYHVNYLLVNNWLADHDDYLNKFTQNETGHLETVWNNERNTLYKIK